VLHRRLCWQHLACCSAQNRDFCLPHLHSTLPLGVFPSEYRHPVSYGKTRIDAATRRWKNFEDIFIRFDMIHERDRHTDTQTDTYTQTDIAWRHRPHLCIASRDNELTSDECQQLATVPLITLGGRTVDYTRWNQILSTHPLGILHTVWCGTTRMVHVVIRR